MDIVEIVTTIAHKISNCKHFFSYHLDMAVEIGRKSEAQNDFISVFFDFLRYSLFARFFRFIFMLSFIPFCADVDSSMCGYLLFAFKQKPLHRCMLQWHLKYHMLRDMLCEWRAKSEIDERVKIKYTTNEMAHRAEEEVEGKFM